MSRTTMDRNGAPLTASDPQIVDSKGNPMTTTPPVSPFGGPASFTRPILPNGAQLYDITQYDDFNSYRPPLDSDVAALLPRFRWRAMLSDARFIYARCGLLAGGVHSKADYAIGDAWNPRYLGEDKDWGKLAEKALRDWHKVLCLRGPAFHWHKCLWLACKSIDVDGDFFIHRTKTADGYPQIQFLEAHRIGTRTGETLVARGKYQNLLMNNGVIIGADGRPVAYRVLGATPAEDADISVSAITHVFDPRWFSQTRGIPSLCYPILHWYDMNEIIGAEKISVKVASTVSLIETNPQGGIDSGNSYIRNGPTGAVPSGLKTEMLSKGQIRYFAANSGSGLKALESNRPSPAWQGFMEKLEADGFIGIDWAVEMVKPGEMRPAAARVVGGKCQRSIRSRQSILRHGAATCDLFALSCFIERGDLPAPPPDWFDWGYSMPPKVSNEVNRDADSDRQDYILGRKNMTELVEADGTDFAAHLQQRADESNAVADILAANPKLKEADFKLLTPNGNPTADQIKGTNQAEDSPKGAAPPIVDSDTHPK